MLRSRSFQIVSVLAAGAMLGYLAASGKIDLNRVAHGEFTQENKPISFEVLLPAHAKLEIDGNKTEETGETRNLHNAALASGRPLFLHLEGKSQRQRSNAEGPTCVWREKPI